MANTILTPDWITREAVAILAEKLNFVTNIFNGYESEFTKDYKVGETVAIRKPAQYKGRSGAALAVEDHVEQSVALVVDQLKGVDVEFTDVEMTLDVNDFSQNVIEPAMATLADLVESTVLETAGGFSIVNGSGGSGEAVYKDYLKAQAFLDNLTTPRDSMRCILVDTLMQVDVIDELKGLFQSADEISKQYKEGKLGKTAGATWYQSSRIPLTATVTTDVLTIDAINGNLITVSGGAAAEVIPAGAQFSLGVDLVHPQNKKTFAGQTAHIVVQSEVTLDGAGAGVIETASPIVSDNTDARQNVASAPTALTIIAEGKKKSLAFHKNFMAFVSPNLTLPKGTDMAERKSYEGLSLRCIRDYDINTNSYPTRFDILFGSKVIRPEYACTVVQG